MIAVAINRPAAQAAGRMTLMGTAAKAREMSLAPMGVVVLDARGVLKAYAAEDGTALRRADIAIGKAYGALSSELRAVAETQNAVRTVTAKLVQALRAAPKTRGRCGDACGGRVADPGAGGCPGSGGRQEHYRRCWRDGGYVG